MILVPGSPDKKLGIIVCADDFGMSSEINSAIIKLSEAKRISAVSCLVIGEAWNEGHHLLKKFQGDVDIGLHLSFRNLPFNKILKLAYLRKVDKNAIFNEFKVQLECFYKKMDCWPDFIDGHEYIHQLPIFRLALIELVSIIRTNKIYIRNTSMSLFDIFLRKVSIFKNIFISIPGRSFKKCLLKRHLYSNNDMLGIYNFNINSDFEVICERFLKNIKVNNSIFVVHPSEESKLCKRENGSLNYCQYQEKKYLSGDSYKITLERHGIYLTRFIY